MLHGFLLQVPGSADAFACIVSPLLCKLCNSCLIVTSSTLTLVCRLWSLRVLYCAPLLQREQFLQLSCFICMSLVEAGSHHCL